MKPFVKVNNNQQYKYNVSFIHMKADRELLYDLKKHLSASSFIHNIRIKYSINNHNFLTSYNQGNIFFHRIAGEMA
jgi:hypothetical protein